MSWYCSRKLLCATSDENWSGKTEIICELSGWPFKIDVNETNYDAAGQAFEELLARTANQSFKQHDAKEPEAELDDEAMAEKFKRAPPKKKPTKVKGLLTEDPYEILGIGYLRSEATEDDIKKAYRKLVLQHHPDKQMAGENAPDDSMFKSLTKAHDMLSDPVKRRAFDSQDPFDDSIPSISIITEDNFFDIYVPIFKRNAKWSKITPVPELGTKSTPYPKVQKFYDFWFEFKTWRSFSYLDEYDPEDAESRDEKRWMERQNERERKRKKKAESKRLTTLVENAYRKDPRIKKQQQKIKDDKKKKKNAQRVAEQKKREQKERMEKEAREKEENERKAQESAERKRKQKEAKLARSQLRKLCSSFNETDQPSTEDVEMLCTKLEVEALRALCEKLQSSINSDSNNNNNTAASIFKEEMTNLLKKEKQIKLENAKKLGKTTTGTPWTDEELALLAQGTAKYPAGTGGRWRVIANFINERTGGERTVKEIISKTKEVVSVPAPATSSATATSTTSASPVPVAKKDNKDSTGQPGSPSTPAVEWSQDQQKALEEAMKKHPVSLGKERWDRIAADVSGKTKRECVQRYKYLVEFYKQNAANNKK